MKWLCVCDDTDTDRGKHVVADSNITLADKRDGLSQTDDHSPL